MARNLLGVMLLSILTAALGCGQSELENAEKTLAVQTRELQIKNQELKTLEVKAKDPKLSNLKESMLRLKAKLQVEIDELQSKVDASKKRIADLEVNEKE